MRTPTEQLMNATATAMDIVFLSPAEIARREVRAALERHRDATTYTEEIDAGFEFECALLRLRSLRKRERTARRLTENESMN